MASDLSLEAELSRQGLRSRSGKKIVLEWLLCMEPYCLLFSNLSSLQGHPSLVVRRQDQEIGAEMGRTNLRESAA